MGFLNIRTGQKTKYKHC